MEKAIKFATKREIKFSCMWTNGESWIDLRHTLEAMENSDHWDAMSDNPMLKKYILKHRRQYIGREDKNGVEIYEGDIIHVKNCGYYRVQYITNQTRFAYFDKDGNDWDVHDIENIGSCEVIGNIYENPELLNN